jgi:hypothetical protein
MGSTKVSQYERLDTNYTEWRACSFIRISFQQLLVLYIQSLINSTPLRTIRSLFVKQILTPQDEPHYFDHMMYEMATVCSHPYPIWAALTLNIAIVLNNLDRFQQSKFQISCQFPFHKILSGTQMHQVFNKPTFQKLTPSALSWFGLLATSGGYMVSKPGFINHLHPHHHG